MQSNLDPRRLMGRTLIGRGGEKIGTIGQVFLDDETGVPEFATVRTGLFGSRQSFVPLAQAQMSDDDVSVPYDKDTIKDAPNLDEDTHLSEQEEHRLYDYYGLSYSRSVSGSGLPTDERDARAREGEWAARTDSRTGTDEAMTRSEEQVRVGTERVERGRARLRKFVVTDEVQQTVPVTREEVRVERADHGRQRRRGDAGSGYF
jgi:sporulation protein YlmC with PRC-barrel domain